MWLNSQSQWSLCGLFKQVLICFLISSSHVSVLQWTVPAHAWVCAGCAITYLVPFMETLVYIFIHCL